jgi:hypothetical protein
MGTNLTNRELIGKSKRFLSVANLIRQRHLVTGAA